MFVSKCHKGREGENRIPCNISESESLSQFRGMWCIDFSFALFTSNQLPILNLNVCMTHFLKNIVDSIS